MAGGVRHLCEHITGRWFAACCSTSRKMGGYRCTQSPAAGHVLLYQQGRCYPSITLQGEQVVWGWGKHLPELGDVFHGASEIGPWKWRILCFWVMQAIFRKSRRNGASIGWVGILEWTENCLAPKRSMSASRPSTCADGPTRRPWPAALAEVVGVLVGSANSGDTLPWYNSLLHHFSVFPWASDLTLYVFRSCRSKTGAIRVPTL